MAFINFLRCFMWQATCK